LQATSRRMRRKEEERHAEKSTYDQHLRRQASLEDMNYIIRISLGQQRGPPLIRDKGNNEFKEWRKARRGCFQNPISGEKDHKKAQTLPPDGHQAPTRSLRYARKSLMKSPCFAGQSGYCILSSKEKRSVNVKRNKDSSFISTSKKSPGPQF